jgi:hypothetical protein
VCNQCAAQTKKQIPQKQNFAVPKVTPELGTNEQVKNSIIMMFE